MAVDAAAATGSLRTLGVSATSAAAGNAAWPVGSIFLSVVSTSPATLLGYGTWSAIGAGRVLVGLDSGDADFDVVEETGGAKTVAAAGSNAAEAAHTHSVTAQGTVAAIASFSEAATTKGAGLSNAAPSPHTHPAPVFTGSPVASGAGSSHNHTFTGSATSVVQPYLVCYMWKRTA